MSKVAQRWVLAGVLTTLVAGPAHAAEDAAVLKDLTAEITWWVLDAKRRGLPLHVALGGTRERVAVGADFGVQDSVDILLEKIQGAVDQGFPRIKLKFRPGWDLDMVEAVRSTFADFT